jgi:hypothetical protein
MPLTRQQPRKEFASLTLSLARAIPGSRFATPGHSASWDMRGSLSVPSTIRSKRNKHGQLRYPVCPLYDPHGNQGASRFHRPHLQEESMNLILPKRRLGHDVSLRLLLDSHVVGGLRHRSSGEGKGPRRWKGGDVMDCDCYADWLEYSEHGESCGCSDCALAKTTHGINCPLYIRTWGKCSFHGRECCQICGPR